MYWGKQNTIKVSVSLISPGRFLSVEKPALTKLLPKPFSSLPPVIGTLVEIKPSAMSKTTTKFLFKTLKGLKHKLNVKRNVKNL